MVFEQDNSGLFVIIRLGKAFLMKAKFKVELKQAEDKITFNAERQISMS